MDKRFLAIIGIVIAIFVGIFLWSSGGNGIDDGSSTTGGQPTNHIRGNTESEIKFVEYTDFECPYCAQYNPITNQLYEKYKDQVSFQFRYYPLPSIHLNAISSARAAEAASKQSEDKFWEMVDLLFDNQDEWSDSNNPLSIFTTYAQQLGLDTEQFKEDYGSSTVNDSINADRREFNKLGLSKSTPTFLLNGKKIQAISVDEFSEEIDAALQKTE